MKKYIVTEELLSLAREFMNKNPHADGCNMNNFWSPEDHCDCSNNRIRRRYIQECQSIVEFKDETPEVDRV